MTEVIDTKEMIDEIRIALEESDGELIADIANMATMFTVTYNGDDMFTVTDEET